MYAAQQAPLLIAGSKPSASALSHANSSRSPPATAVAQECGVAEVPQTHYAKTPDGVSIAYQVMGDGPIDLVFVPGWVNHVEWAWENPGYARLLERLASFARLIWFDKRGLGLSDRPERLATLEDQMVDVGAVLDAVGSERAALLGTQDGATPGLFYAAAHPERILALVLYAGLPRFLASDDYPFGISEVMVQHWLHRIERAWGRDVPSDLQNLAPSRLQDTAFRKWYAQFCRLAASPSAIRELMRIFTLHDMRGVLPAVRVPTLVLNRAGDAVCRVENARYMAEHIPNARLIELAGNDTLIYAGDVDAVIDEVQEFLTGVRDSPNTDRVLATVLMTDIVGSTERATALGDRRWHDLLDSHDRVVDRQLERFRGRKVNPTGDGMLATFDGPRELCVAPKHSSEPPAASTSTSAPVSTPARSSSAATTSAASPSISAHESRRSPAPAKYSSPEPSPISSRDPASSSKTTGNTRSKECKNPGDCSPSAHNAPHRSATGMS